MKDKIKKIFKKIGALLQKLKVKIKPVTVPGVIEENADLDKKLVFSLAKKRFPSWQQLQYLPQYLTRKEKVIIRCLIGIIIISLVFLIFKFYQRHVVYLPKNGGTYSEALVGQPNYLNPVLAQNDVDHDIVKLVYSGLFTYNQAQQLLPDLAESYQLSDDKKTYTIKLRGGLKWQNGNELLADDILFTFETIQNPEYNSPYLADFNGVTVERIDDHTVSFTLPRPFAPFLSNLTIGILPAHLWGDVSPSNFRLAEFNNKPIGSGPYVFKELTKDRTGNVKSYTLEKNTAYYRREPYLDKIILKFYPDFESALNALKNNNVAGLSYLPKDLSASLNQNKNITIHSLQLPQYSAVFFNQKNPLLKDKSLKQALALALDKNNILAEALNGQGKVVDGPILDGYLGYYPGIKKYEYNPAKAGEILDSLGWKVPAGGGVRQKGSAELKFSLTTVDQPEYLKTANLIRQKWEALNIGIELKIMNPSRVEQEVITPKNYDAFLYGEILGADPDPYPFWHSTQISSGLNLSNYYNKDVDKLLEESRQTDNPDERTKKYIDFQNILAEEVPAIFLYSPSYDYAITEKIKGLKAKGITVPSDRFNGVEDWYLKTRLGWE